MLIVLTSLFSTDLHYVQQDGIEGEVTIKTEFHAEEVLIKTSAAHSISAKE